MKALRYLSVIAITLGLWLLLARLLAMVPLTPAATDWLVRFAGFFGGYDVESVERVWVASVFVAAAIVAVAVVWLMLRAARHRNRPRSV